MWKIYLKLVNEAIYLINELKNDIINNEIPENENSKKIIDIVERIIKFDKEQKGTGLEILTLKQKL